MREEEAEDGLVSGGLMYLDLVCVGLMAFLTVEADIGRTVCLCVPVFRAVVADMGL